MTDDEIKKALECCIEGKCQLCPLYDNDTIADNCPTGLLKLCLDLINRKQAEIEKYKNGIKKLIKKHQLYKDNMDATREYQLQQAKSEAIKELIALIQEQSFIDQLSLDGEKIVYMKDIDSLAEEMINQII